MYLEANKATSGESDIPKPFGGIPSPKDIIIYMGDKEMIIQCNESKTEIHLLEIKDKNMYAALLEEINLTLESWRRINE